MPLANAVDISAYGGKTARLAGALRAGLRVPDGFALPAVVVARLRAGDTATRVSVRRDLSAVVAGTGLAGPFAVRSSGKAEDGADASFAGMYRTILNVEPDVDRLLAAIEECAAAADALRLREYVATTGTSEADTIAILIQQMIPAEVAGVAFSESHGAHGDYVVIEAVPGLGEALVSGSATPSRYLFPLPLAADAAKQRLQVTGDNQLGRFAVDVAWLALRAAELFGAQQDIEWAIADGWLWLLQSRPITAPVTVADELATTATDALLSGFGAAPGVVTAEVRVLPDADAPFHAGAILVATNTDTDFLPAMRQASGFVTEEGGLLSHAALVARELGLPCIVGAANATSLVVDGQLVTVDGSSGLVFAGAVEPDGIAAGGAYDFAGLYCFDTVLEQIVGGVTVLIEPTAQGYAAWLPTDVEDRQRELAPLLRRRLAAPVRFPVSDKHSIYTSFTRRLRASPVFRGAFGELLATTWMLDSDRLKRSLALLFAHSQACLTSAERESDALTTYLLLDAVGGNYLLANTLLPEGYGIRAVYQTIASQAWAAGVSVGAYLVNQAHADEPAVRYCRVLVDARESSYPAYVAFGGTDEPYHERLTAARDQLAAELGVVGQDRAVILAAIANAAERRPEVWDAVPALP